jgi:hypothetical protein
MMIMTLMVMARDGHEGPRFRQCPGMTNSDYWIKRGSALRLGSINRFDTSFHLTTSPSCKYLRLLAAVEASNTSLHYPTANHARQLNDFSVLDMVFASGLPRACALVLSCLIRKVVVMPWLCAKRVKS